MLKMTASLRPPILVTAAALGLAAGAARAQDAGADVLRVREIGSYHVGGREVVLSGLPQQEVSFTAGMAPLKVDPNGQFEAFQMYVQYVRLAEPRARYPLLMWHGGGLTGVTWETKPDGQPGWQSYFLRQGHDVYVSDAVERGRASWARYPDINPAPPFFRPKQEAWELFRIGPVGSWATRTAFPGTQFPTDAVDQFAKQAVPRFATSDVPTQAAYDAYVQKACPCVIVVHSQGGNFAFNAALHAPDKIKAIIAVEPSGAPPASTDVSALKGVPHLFVWGDHLNDHPLWPRFVTAVAAYRDNLLRAGATADWMVLPERGITGNTHMLMMDRNSDQIAVLIQEWVTKQGLMK